LTIHASVESTMPSKFTSVPTSLSSTAASPLLSPARMANGRE
jgi:hypothetical protein